MNMTGMCGNSIKYVTSAHARTHAHAGARARTHTHTTRARARTRLCDFMMYLLFSPSDLSCTEGPEGEESLHDACCGHVQKVKKACMTRAAGMFKRWRKPAWRVLRACSKGEESLHDACCGHVQKVKKACMTRAAGMFKRWRKPAWRVLRACSKDLPRSSAENCKGNESTT